MIRALRVVFVKEAQDVLRDRRALFFLIAPPFLLPLFLVAAAFFLGWQVSHQAPGGLPVAVQGQEYAPGLADALAQNTLLKLVEPPPDPVQALRSGEIAALLTVAADTPARLEAEQAVTITIMTSRVGWMPMLADLTIRGVVDGYAETLLGQRLASRGLEPDWAQPLRLVEVDAPTVGIVAPPVEVGGAEPMPRSFNSIMLPFLVASWSMGGGLGFIAYMTVGEKERGTMEPLLVTTASRVGIVMGKIALSMLVSLITIVLWAFDWLGYLALVNFSATFGALQPAALSLQLEAFGVAGVWLLLLMLPLMTMVSGLTAAICTFSRNYREANLFLTVIQLGLPGLSFAAAFVVSPTPGPVVYALPFVGVLVAVRDLFLRGLPPAMLALVAVTSVVYAALSILLAAYVFSREWALMRGL